MILLGNNGAPLYWPAAYTAAKSVIHVVQDAQKAVDVNGRRGQRFGRWSMLLPSTTVSFVQIEF